MRVQDRGPQLGQLALLLALADHEEHLDLPHGRDGLHRHLAGVAGADADHVELAHSPEHARITGGRRARPD
ncbi:Uncharacterised protein [Mycobacteroides abscessus subsp. abscessus]|nr:Uncharacterised protein [Mycobacteroides abscessus subsp. abscessus]